MSTIAAEWAEFAAAVEPTKPTETELRHLRGAFYAGAFAMEALQRAITNQNLSERAVAWRLRALQEELVNFSRHGYV